MMITIMVCAQPIIISENVKTHMLQLAAGSVCVCLYLYVVVCVCFCLSVSVCVCPCMSLYVSVCIYASLYVSVCLSVFVCLCLSLGLLLSLYDDVWCLSLSGSICHCMSLCVNVCHCLSVCSFIIRFSSLFRHVSWFAYLCPTSFFLSMYLSLKALDKSVDTIPYLILANVFSWLNTSVLTVVVSVWVAGVANAVPIGIQLICVEYPWTIVACVTDLVSSLAVTVRWILRVRLIRVRRKRTVVLWMEIIQLRVLYK